MLNMDGSSEFRAPRPTAPPVGGGARAGRRRCSSSRSGVRPAAAAWHAGRPPAPDRPGSGCRDPMRSAPRRWMAAHTRSGPWVSPAWGTLCRPAARARSSERGSIALDTAHVEADHVVQVGSERKQQPSSRPSSSPERTHSSVTMGLGSAMGAGGRSGGPPEAWFVSNRRALPTASSGTPRSA